MSEQIIDLCISVVGGGNPQMALDSLSSLVDSLSGELSVQIHFIDNAAPLDWFKDAHLISPAITVHRNAHRKGFGANHNAIMSTVRARYYLLLNDDTHIYKGCCEELVKAAQAHPECGIFGSKLFNPDGSVQPSVYRFPSLSLALSQVFLLNRLFRCSDYFDDYAAFSYDEERNVDFVCGASILVRAETLADVGLLDEGFFMYAEETDWCMRARKSGWLTRFVPQSKLIHYGGQSTVTFSQERSVEFLRSNERLIRKHFGARKLSLYKLLNLAKHLPRFLFTCCSGGPEHKRLAEKDTVLWSLGQLNRPGLYELSQEGNRCRETVCQ